MNAKKPAKPATKKTGKLSVKEEAVGVKAGSATALTAAKANITGAKINSVKDSLGTQGSSKCDCGQNSAGCPRV